MIASDKTPRTFVSMATPRIRGCWISIQNRFDAKYGFADRKTLGCYAVDGI